MRTYDRLWLVLGYLMMSSSLFAHEWVKTYALDGFIGPEIYHVTRTKEKGAKQTGILCGVRVGYDSIKRYKFYWGADFLWAQGCLEGHSENGHLKSTLTDTNIETRVGYTLQHKSWRCISFTPYIGVGYFWERNKFRHPSPLHVHLDNTFLYVPFGFLSEVFLTSTLSVGLNFKVRLLLEGRQEVSHDPQFGHSTQYYDMRFHYRVECPWTYFFCWKSHSFGGRLIPFYEFRRYGHRANFPFDFLDTRFNCYGATLEFLYLF